MSIHIGQRLLFGLVASLAFLAGCQPALQWRTVQTEPRTKFVCSVNGLSRSCVRLTEAEFRDVTRRLQPDA